MLIVGGRCESALAYASRTGSNFNTFGLAWQYRWGGEY
jgi:hypothetical protein